MIINCINCKKKFEVNSSLIPENGRLYNVEYVIIYGFINQKNQCSRK